MTNFSRLKLIPMVRRGLSVPQPNELEKLRRLDQFDSKKVLNITNMIQYYQNSTHYKIQ